MSDNQRDRFLSLLAVCGIIGPILYTTALFILGLIRPGYNHVTQFMSELGEAGGSNAIIMNIAGFIMLGLLMIAFAFGLHRGIGEGRGSRMGPALVALSGGALVMTGIFPCDLGCVDVSLTGSLHSIFATIAAFAMMLAPLPLYQRLRRNSRWQDYSAYSLVTVFVALAVSTVYGFNVFEQWKGALQRFSMGVSLLWIEVIAVKLLLLSMRRPASEVAKPKDLPR